MQTKTVICTYCRYQRFALRGLKSNVQFKLFTLLIKVLLQTEVIHQFAPIHTLVAQSSLSGPSTQPSILPKPCLFVATQLTWCMFIIYSMKMYHISFLLSLCFHINKNPKLFLPSSLHHNTFFIMCIRENPNCTNVSVAVMQSNFCHCLGEKFKSSAWWSMVQQLKIHLGVIDLGQAKYPGCFLSCWCYSSQRLE